MIGFRELFLALAANACITLVVGAGDSDARARINHLRMPAHGSVHKGILYGFFDNTWIYGPPGVGDWARPYIDAIPVKKNARMNWKEYDVPSVGSAFNCRHHIGNGCLWFSSGPYLLSQVKFEELHRFEYDPPPRKKDQLDPPQFFLKTLREEYRRILEDGAGNTPLMLLILNQAKPSCVRLEIF